MDEVMANLFGATTENKKNHFGSKKIVLSAILLLVLIILASTPYGYTYYQQSKSAKHSQLDVKQELTLLLQTPDVIEYSWMRTLNPKAKSIEGGIVWSQEKQVGIMKFKNLSATPKQQQYHLWLYDRSSDQRISSIKFQQHSFDSGTRLVEFQPEKRVESPYKFILSLESLQGDKENDEVLLRIQP